MNAPDLLAVIDLALESVARAGADAADCVLVESDSVEARVRDAEIDFVKQARERTLGIRALVGGDRGKSSAITATSDLSEAAVTRMASETVALARTTAVLEGFPKLKAVVGTFRASPGMKHYLSVRGDAGKVKW